MNNHLIYKIKSILKPYLNIFLFFFSISFTLILIEFFLIFDDYYREYSKPHITSINDVNYKLYFDYNDLKKDKKVFLIGDSFIQGDFCAFDQKTLPDEMQKINNNFTFINLGSSGKSLPNYLDILNKIKPNKNDKVILFLYDNDIFVSREMCKLATIHNNKYGTYLPKFCTEILNYKIKEKSENSFLKFVNSKIRNLKTVAVIKDALINIPYFEKFYFRSEYNKLWTNFDSEENIYITNLIIEIKNLIENIGAEFYLTYFPNTTFISINNPEAERWKIYLNFLKLNYNINSLNPYLHLTRNASKKSMTRSYSDDHPSCDVYKILAGFYNDKIEFLK